MCQASADCHWADRRSVRRCVVRGAFAVCVPTFALYAQQPRDTTSVGVIIYATVSAREMRFAQQPEVTVRLSGGLDSVHVLERRNLPSPVAVGATYHDVYVSVEIFGRVTAQCIAASLRRSGIGADVSRLTTAATDTACATLELRGSTPRLPPPPRDSSTLRRE